MKAEPGRFYIHKKSERTYLVLVIARIEATPDERVVVYQHADGQTWTRPVAEFEDGRFYLHGDQLSAKRVFRERQRMFGVKRSVDT